MYVTLMVFWWFFDELLALVFGNRLPSHHVLSECGNLLESLNSDRLRLAIFFFFFFVCVCVQLGHMWPLFAHCTCNKKLWIDKQQDVTLFLMTLTGSTQRHWQKLSMVSRTRSALHLVRNDRDSKQYTIISFSLTPPACPFHGTVSFLSFFFF